MKSIFEKELPLSEKKIILNNLDKEGLNYFHHSIINGNSDFFDYLLNEYKI